jgi:hypothetical protein
MMPPRQRRTPVTRRHTAGNVARLPVTLVNLPAGAGDPLIRGQVDTASQPHHIHAVLLNQINQIFQITRITHPPINVRQR